MWVELIISIFMLAGGVFILVGSIGVIRMPDVYIRLHGPTKATTLGMAGILIGAMIFFSYTDQGLRIKALLISVFLFLTAPVSGHMLMKSALHRRLPCKDNTTGQDQVERG